MDTFSIIRLYENVLNDDLASYNIPEDAVRMGIEAMSHVYRPETVSLRETRSMVADYNDAAHRCAYLHKFAAFHTKMVRDMLLENIRTNYTFFNDLLFSSRHFEICSLGGGPGSDVIGALAAFHYSYPNFNMRATIIDYMVNWRYSFSSILRELGSSFYGSFGVCSRNLDWRYVGANLLKTLTPEVLEALSSADLITMIKFSSAAACQGTQKMMKNIFSAMKPGAAVLFIDNDGGGFHDIFAKAAHESHFISVHGPVRHQNYIQEDMKIKRFGFNSCFKTTVTVHIVKKPYISPYMEYSHRRVVIDSPFAPSPPTPMLFRADDLGCSRELPPSRPARPTSSCVATPLFSGANSPLASRWSATPDSHHKRKHRGCLPLKRWRNNLARNVYNFKYRAQNVINRRFKRAHAHPIFKI